MKLPAELRKKVLAAAGVPELPAGPGDLCGVFAAVRQAGFPDPVPEHRFHPARKWRFDWCWPDLRVALERHGGDWRPVLCPGCGHRKTVFVSRHHSRDGLEADLEKMNAAAVLGWLVVAVTPGMILDGRATAAVLDALARPSRHRRQENAR